MSCNSQALQAVLEEDTWSPSDSTSFTYSAGRGNDLLLLEGSGSYHTVHP